MSKVVTTRFPRFTVIFRSDPFSSGPPASSSTFTRVAREEMVYAPGFFALPTT
jgi:hypothetical protein